MGAGAGVKVGVSVEVGLAVAVRSLAGGKSTFGWGAAGVGSGPE